MRFRDLLRDVNRHEQKLEDVLLYVDFLNHELPIILLKDGSLLVLFQISGLDYEGLSEDQKEQFSHYARGAFEQLPDEGSGFMLTNLMIRDTPRPLPLRENPNAPPLIQFVQGKKQAFWDDLIAKSFGNRILCGLRYYPPKKKEPGWGLLIQESKLFRFYLEQIRTAVDKLEQGYLALASGFNRFGFRPLDREQSFAALYELVNFTSSPAYRPDLSLNAQLAQSHYLFRPGEEYLVINGREYISLIGMKYPPPTSLAMYLRRFYELGFPLVLRQSIGFAPKERLFKQQDFNTPIALALSTVDPKNLKYVEEVKDFRSRIENEKELPVWWHFSVLVRAGDKETLRARRAEVITLLKEIGSFGIPEKRNLKTGFFSVLPGHDRFYLRKSLLGTANAGDLLSAYVLYQGDKDPVDYLQDRLQGVFAYNPFTSRERAHHRAICGPTVGGKSFFVIKDLLSHLVANPMIWVVDLSASYLDFFELLREELPSETAIMRVSRQESNFEFNPFLVSDPQAPVPEEQFDFCMGLLKLMAGPKLTDPANEMAMRKGLAEFFNAYRILLRNQQERTPVPPMTLLASILEMEIQNPELASAFSLWTVGRRGELFNTGRDTLQSARYCYFDLRDLDGEPELMTAIVYVIFSKVYRDIADERLRSVQKRFVLDEAHRYITDPAFSYWIALLARTGRHWNIMLDLITQSLADLDSPDQPWSKAIITNLKQAFFFPGQKDVESSFRKLQLTEYHIEQYKKLDPSRYEVLYWSDGGLRRMLRSVADPYTYWLATTDARERVMKRLMKERHGGNVRQAIEELVQLTGRCRTTEERLAILEPYFRRTFEETMKKILLSVTLLFLLNAHQAHAFVFTDVVAQVQRILMIVQASQYIQQINTYRTEFDKYKTIFDDYFKSFHVVYRRLSSADWQDFVPTNWLLLKDHFITMWKTFDEPAWQSQVLALKTTPLYSVNPDYRAYADNLISLSDEQVAQLKREEAHLIELQNQDLRHHEDLEKFKLRNASLTLGEDKVGNEIALSQQIALTNAILIELASIQTEVKVVEQRLLTDQKEQRNLIARMKQLEVDSQAGDVKNLDILQSLTKAK